jgi:hypothetical protein
VSLSVPDAMTSEARALVGLKVVEVKREVAFSISIQLAPPDDSGQRVMLWIHEAGWRIEEDRRIVCGCYDEDAKDRATSLLVASLVESVNSVRRDIKLSMSSGRTLWLLQRSSTLWDWLIRRDDVWFSAGPGEVYHYEQK